MFVLYPFVCVYGRGFHLFLFLRFHITSINHFRVYSSIAVSTFTMYNHESYQALKHFHHSKKNPNSWQLYVLAGYVTSLSLSFSKKEEANRTLVAVPPQPPIPSSGMGGDYTINLLSVSLLQPYFLHLTPEMLSYQVKVIVITVIYGNCLSFKP